MTDDIERLRADLDAYQKERDEEVVRLRVELAAEKDRGNNWREACQVQNERVEKVITERDALRAERDALRELLAEAVQWLCVSDLPCAMTIHRINAALNKGGGDE